jgi:hypothetical protein
MLCPLWDPTVFTVVEYILVKTFKKVLILFIKCFIYRLCLNIKILKKFFLNGALMFTGYSTVSSQDIQLTVEYPVNFNALLRKNFFNVLMFKHRM